MPAQQVTINPLAVADTIAPMPVQYAARFDATVLQYVTRLTAAPPTSVDGAPVLTEVPSSVARSYAGADGQAWFVPMAVIPPKSKTSATPAVFLDHEPDRWVLRVTVDLRRHPAVPDTAQPLPIGDFALGLSTSVPGSAPVVFDSVTDVPSPEPAVLRRVVAIAAVDQNRVAAILMEDQTAMFTVTASVQYADPAAATDPDPGPRFDEVLVRDHRTLATARVSGVQRATVARLNTRVLAQPGVAASTPPAAAAPAAFLGAQRFLTDAVLDVPAFRFPRPQRTAPPQPTARRTTVSLADGPGISAWFPTTVHANRPIYALVDSGFGVDPDSAWRMSPAGPWKDTGIPGRYYLLPTEYRLAFDSEAQLPAVTVVLVHQETPAGQTPGAPESAYRVRVRFKVVPWFDPDAVAALRDTIESVEGVTFPDFEVGGDDGATFSSTALLADLGGQPVGDDGLAVDSRGFEYVVEGTLEYYTLLTKLLAPPVGSAPGLEGQVRCTLKAAADDPAPQVRDIPVRLRLDRPATDLLAARLLPPPPIEQWPAGWAPPVFAAVSSRAQLPVDVTSVHATLLVVDPEVRQPIEAIAAIADPGAFALGAADRPVPAPVLQAAPPPPAYPTDVLAAPDDAVHPEIELLQDRLADLGHPVSVTGILDSQTADAVTAAQAAAGLDRTGTVDKTLWERLFPAAAPPPPGVGPGEALLELTPAEPVDPRVVGALAVSFGGVSVQLDPHRVLERVHELAASGSLQSALRVRSYQLQHPENLPPALADLYALDVEIRRIGGTPVTVFLSRDEPEKTAQIGFTVADLLGGATPGAPTYEWRRRNQTPAGTGAFSDWETISGNELYVTPVG